MGEGEFAVEVEILKEVEFNVDVGAIALSRALRLERCSITIEDNLALQIEIPECDCCFQMMVKEIDPRAGLAAIGFGQTGDIRSNDRAGIIGVKADAAIGIEAKQANRGLGDSQFR